jgi:lipopolysaccharide transport system ATP-binding protein
MNTVSVRGLSKRFTLLGRSPQYRSVQEWFSFRRTLRPAVQPRTFLALDGLTFETQLGEVVGIIGRNGAGKSTLLKILSRILRPTTGSIRLNGRVGSLLEVGSGFHPELTGRENIFLNGAILGMSHAEIQSRFDEIVAFAGVENYLDEPVKHYSSGMYMRLAFAVAAHIEPEILLLDEVLAVGDADFQKKCLRKLEDVGGRGRTVLFVSHNMQAVLRFCSRAILLEGGKLIEDGPVKDVVATYLRRGGGSNGERIYADEHHAPGDEYVRLRSVRVRSRDGETQTEIDIGEEFGVEMELRLIGGGMTLFPLITINNEWGPVLSTNDVTADCHGSPRPPGLYRFTAWVPANLLAPGSMTISVSVHSFRTYIDREHLSDPDAVSFIAMETAEGARGHFGGYMPGVVRPLLSWTAELLH